MSILTDHRGWARAGVRFVVENDAPYLLVLAEGEEVDRLCEPFETEGRFSCQNGPVVALNADRWRAALPDWPGDLDSYRAYLVNHEVGGPRPPRVRKLIAPTPAFRWLVAGRPAKAPTYSRGTQEDLDEHTGAPRRSRAAGRPG